MFVLILIGLIISLISVYLTGRYNEYYWKKRGVAFYSRHRVTGVLWDFLTQDRAVFQIFQDIYKQYPKEPAVGIGSFHIPTLYVKDPQNVQHVLQSDFQSFNHRAIESTPADLLADNLLFMHGLRWKLLRQKLTPLFTSAKLRNMFFIIDKSATDFVSFLKNNPEHRQGNPFDIFTTFCSAAVGAAIFGITMDSIFDSPFLTMARNALSPTPMNILKNVVISLCPPLARALGLKMFGEYEEFFIKAIREVIRQRENETVKKYDFADMCVTLQKNGTMKDSETGFEMEPTDELLAAQAFFFYIAGVEPTATAIYATLIELGKRPEILERMCNEIDETFERCDGKITFDVVTEMKYLDKVLNEALRMHPPIGNLTRQCVRDTVLPVGNIKIDKGTRVFIPLYEFHHDSAVYKNPEVFDPERWSDINLSSHDSLYMAFGKGQRICIGMRYAQYQVKAVLFHLLRHFTVKIIELEGGIKYLKHPSFVRLTNVDIDYIPRKIKIN